MHSKMTLTYVFHSCFVLETEKSILIFDYWLDLNGVVPPFLKKDKPVYVFSSHFHEDHFNRAIFEWRKQREGITYIEKSDFSYTISAKSSTFAAKFEVKIIINNI